MDEKGGKVLGRQTEQLMW